LLGNRLVVLIALALTLLTYNIGLNSIERSTPNVTVAEANILPWLTEFTYEIDAPEYAKELSNKVTEKYYRLYNASYNVPTAEVGALLVQVHVMSKPLNEHETKIDFKAKAKHVYAKGDYIDVKKKRAEVSGYSILNSNTQKLFIHIPWAEILKNM